MYSDEIIEKLETRIGFGKPLENGFTPELEEANSTGSTERIFTSFHSLVTVENIFAATPFDNTKKDEFNAFLNDLRHQATLEVIPLIMDKNIKYDNAVNYDKTINDNAILFDDAIGFNLAIKALELFMTTKESNLTERNAKMAISNLKLELEGFRNDQGVLVAKGLVHKYDNAIQKATKKIFPIVATVGSDKIW